MHIYMGERIAGKQDRPNNWFSIVFPCCTYVSTVKKSVPLDFMEEAKMTREKMKLSSYFLF